MSIWEVVGGGDKHGILVRKGEDLASDLEPERLSTGAFVLEQELLGDRLRYRLIRGSGPASGWVTARYKDKALLVRAPGEPLDDGGGAREASASVGVNGGGGNGVRDAGASASISGGHCNGSYVADRGAGALDAGPEARLASLERLVGAQQAQIRQLSDFSARLFQELSDLHLDHMGLRENHRVLCNCLVGNKLLHSDVLAVVVTSQVCPQSQRCGWRLNPFLGLVDEPHVLHTLCRLVGARGAGAPCFFAVSRAFAKAHAVISTLDSQPYADADPAATDAGGASETPPARHRLDNGVWSKLKSHEPSQSKLDEWARSQTVQAVLGAFGVEGIVGKISAIRFSDVYVIFGQIGLSMHQFVNKFKYLPSNYVKSDAAGLERAADAILRRCASLPVDGADTIACRDLYRLFEIIGYNLQRFKAIFPDAAVVHDPVDGKVVQQPPVKIGSYRIKRIIGQGFKGVRCYLAEHTSDSTTVAVKYPTPKDEVSVVKAIQERAPQDCLGLPRLLASGMHNNQPYIITELLGSPLTKVFQRIYKYPLRKRWRALCVIGRLAVRRLQALHSCGYVHCDVSPENILLGRARGPGGAKPSQSALFLIDFELAQKRGGGAKVEGHIGSTEWSSIRSADTVERLPVDDLEALGWVLLHGLFGSLPWFEFLQLAYRDWESRWIKAQTIKQVQRSKLWLLQEGWAAFGKEKSAKVPDPLISFLRACHAATHTYESLTELLGGAPDLSVQEAERVDIGQFAEHVEPLL